MTPIQAPRMEATTSNFGAQLIRTKKLPRIDGAPLPSHDLQDASGNSHAGNS